MMNNYELHCMACQMFSEASTIFLKPRAIMITLHGNADARKRPAFRKVTLLFGITFLIVRIGYLGTRNGIHLALLGQRIARGATIPCWTSLAGRYIDFSLCVMINALNLFWARLLIKGALRASKRPKAA